MALYIDEIFLSIQGESNTSGIPTTFVRLYGCNVGCSFCDQPQSLHRKMRMSVENVISQIERLGARYVCVTGGEPLLQPDIYSVVYDLVGKGYQVSIETSGCVAIDPDPYLRSYRYVMDIKCPSSGVSDKNVYENLMHLKAKDEVKYVLSNREDYDFFKRIYRTYPTVAGILLSPVIKHTLRGFRPLIGRELVDWVITDRLFNVRVQIQLHKFIGVQ